MKRIIFILFFLFVCKTSFSAIAFDSAASNSSLATSLSVSHTLGSGSNRMVVFCITNEFGAISNVQYNGVTMNLAVSNTAGGRLSYVYYLMEPDLPSAGTYNATLTIDTAGNGTVGGVMSFTGVKNQAPEATTTGSTTSTSISTDIVTLTDGAVVIDGVYGSEINTFTPTGSNQTEGFDRSAVGGSLTGAGSYNVTTTAGSKTVAWTASTTVDFRDAIASFAAQPTGTTVWNGAVNGVLR